MGRAGAGEPNEIKCHPPGQTPRHRHGAESQVLNMKNGPTLTPSRGDINSFVKRRERERRESQVINIRLMLRDHENGHQGERGTTQYSRNLVDENTFGEKVQKEKDFKKNMECREN